MKPASSTGWRPGCPRKAPMPSAPAQRPSRAQMSRPARWTSGWGMCATGCGRLDGTPAWRSTRNGLCWDSFERWSWRRSRTSGSSTPCDRGRARSAHSPRSRRRRGSWSSTTWRIRRSRRPTGGWSGCCCAKTRQGSRVTSEKRSARRRTREASRERSAHSGWPRVSCGSFGRVLPPARTVCGFCTASAWPRSGGPGLSVDARAPPRRPPTSGHPEHHARVSQISGLEPVAPAAQPCG